MKFYIFYSKYCKQSITLIELINKYKLLEECILIDSDQNKSKIPIHITSIPTIIAPNISKPLIGIDAINWIENKQYFNQTTNNINNNNVIQPNIKSEFDELAFNKKEATSISDHYTNINDTQINKNMLDFNKLN